MRRYGYTLTDRHIPEEVFAHEYVNSPGREFLIQNRCVKGYRVKIIRSGDMVECEVYPIWKQPSGRTRAPKRKTSRTLQRELNNINAEKRLKRLINTNFTYRDTWATFSYSDDKLPSSIEAAQKDMQNYLRRLKHYIMRHGLPELKYIYITEYDNDPGHPIRVHHHLVTNCRDRDTIEALWNGGARTQARRLQPDILTGLDGMASYLSKDPRGKKRYVVSKNLKQPYIEAFDGKTKKTEVYRILRGELDAESYFEKTVKECAGFDCKFVRLDKHISDFVSGAYLYVRLRC